MDYKDNEKDEKLLGSVVGGILGFFGIQSEEQKKAELIQKGAELEKLQTSITILNRTIQQLKNQEKELDEKRKLMQTEREEKQRQAYLKANRKRIIISKLIKYLILFSLGSIIPITTLLLFKLIIFNNINSKFYIVLLIFLVFLIILSCWLPKEKNVYVAPNKEENEIIQEYKKL